jgi:Arc/MetJ-type ribon-helix-helix transcriptional regulator
MSDKREKISVTIPRELIDWIDEMVEKRVFANRSHAVEVCVLKYLEYLRKGE